VRVFGHARCAHDQVLRVTGFNVRTITDFNEVRRTAFVTALDVAALLHPLNSHITAAQFLIATLQACRE
jgi:hypothetical protein